MIRKLPVSTLKRNLVANYLGQGWTAAMGLVFVPLYVRYLGMESYGLIGVFSVLQTWMALLDMGMTPTLNREMARFKAGAHTAQSIRDLLRSLELVCFGVASVIGVAVWASSGYLAADWLRVQSLPATTVAQAISVMAVVVALRFVEGVYRGSLFGLQKQVWYNVASAAIATTRHGGAVLILVFVSPTAKAFFAWQGLISAVSIAIFALSVHRALPRAPVHARFSSAALAQIGHYAGGMLGITLLSLLLTQSDKVILSRMLNLTEFGYYTLAATVAGTLYLAISPITQSVFPRMVELATSADTRAVASVYHSGAQLVTALTAPAAAIAFVFAEAAVFVWSGDHALAARVGPILGALALGTFLNGVMWMPHQCQLAHGWTSLAVRTNLTAVAVLIPAIVWVVPRSGAIGAAWIWVALNSGYVLIAIQFMHRRLLIGEKWSWYVYDILLPLLGACAVVAVAWVLRPSTQVGRIGWAAFLLATGSIACLASVGLANRLRTLTGQFIAAAWAGRSVAAGARPRVGPT